MGVLKREQQKTCAWCRNKHPVAESYRVEAWGHIRWIGVKCYRRLHAWRTGGRNGSQLNG